MNKLMILGLLTVSTTTFAQTYVCSGVNAHGEKLCANVNAQFGKIQHIYEVSELEKRNEEKATTRDAFFFTTSTNRICKELFGEKAQYLEGSRVISNGLILQKLSCKIDVNTLQNQDSTKQHQQLGGAQQASAVQQQRDCRVMLPNASKQELRVLAGETINGYTITKKKNADLSHYIASAQSLDCRLYRALNGVVEQGNFSIGSLAHAFSLAIDSKIKISDESTKLDIVIDGLVGYQKEVTHITVTDQQTGLTAIYGNIRYPGSEREYFKTIRAEAHYQKNIISAVCFLK